MTEPATNPADELENAVRGALGLPPLDPPTEDDLITAEVERSTAALNSGAIEGRALGL